MFWWQLGGCLPSSSTLFWIYTPVSRTCYLWSLLMSSLSLSDPVNQGSSAGVKMCSHLCASFLLETHKTEQSHILFRVLFQCSQPSVAQRVCRASTMHTVRTPVSIPTHIWGTIIRHAFNFFMMPLRGGGGSVVVIRP